MGIFAVQKKDVEVSSSPLVKAMKYLGLFGIIHGLSEWVTIVVIAGLYPDSYITLFIIKQILKAISFAYLMYFGFTLFTLKESVKWWIKKLPFILLVVWLGGFIFLINSYDLDYHILNPKYNTIWLRYIMAFLGGTSSALALYLNGNLMEKRNLNKIALKYKKLALILLVYGIIDGLFVRPREFSPANVVNNELFENIFRFPIQVGKITVGIGINFLLIRVIETFSWEQKEKLNKLQKQKTVNEERRKLGMEISPEKSTQIYYAVREAISNVLKHSKATSLEGIFGDRGVHQVAIQFHLEDNVIYDVSYRHLEHGGIDYRDIDEDHGMYGVLEQHEQIIEYLEGEDIRTVLADLFNPGDFVEDVDGFSGATVRANKVYSAMRDALNRGLY